MSDDENGSFLSVKNWTKFQRKLKNGRERRDWIAVQTNLEDDPQYLRLKCFSRYILEGVWRIRGRTGRNPPNDAVYIARALQVEAENRHNVGRAIGELVVSGFLILSNQQIEVESALQDKTRQDKTTYTPLPPKGKAPKKPEAEFSLPSWVPSDEWLGYLEMRIKIRKPMTTRAMKLAVNILDGLREHGQSPTAILNQSIMNSWQSLYPVNGGNGNGNKAESRSEYNHHSGEEALRRAAERDSQKTGGDSRFNWGNDNS